MNRQREPLNYTKHTKMEGLGVIQEDIKGFVQHNSLALSPDGLPLGLINQRMWARQSDEPKVHEGRKWVDFGLKPVCEYLANHPRVVLIQDREADNFEFLTAERPENVDYLVRVYQTRGTSCLAGRVRGSI